MGQMGQQHRERRFAIAYLLGGHHRSEAEIQRCKTALETRARKEDLVVLFSLIEHDTSRRPKRAQMFSLIESLRNLAQRIHVVIVPTRADLGWNESAQTTVKERLERLGASVIASDDECQAHFRAQQPTSTHS